MKKNTILFLEWHSFGTPFVIQAFQKLGYSIIRETFPRDKIDTRNDAEYTERLVHLILGREYACVFTFNYFPVVAIACKACRIPYVSWTYDSPYVQLYSKTLEFDTNFAFVFDSHTVQELRSMGYHNVYYMPMAIPEDDYEKMLRKPYNKSHYQCEAAFVGSLYSEDFHNPFRKMQELTGYYKGLIDGLLQAQRKVYGYQFLQEILEEMPDLVEQIDRLCPFLIAGDGLETIEWIYANYYLLRQVTALDRQMLLKQMAEHFHTCVYTPEKSHIPHADTRGKADYYTEAPYVYHNSKVNLNITLRSIQTGIPLRAFDIMGCGGFLLSNWQEDFLEYFEPDEDMALYESSEEAVDKAAFYLKHETQRRKIAENGRQKVRKEHTYLHRIKGMSVKIEDIGS